MNLKSFFVICMALLCFFPIFAETTQDKPGFRIDFTKSVQKGKSISNWLYKGRPGTPDVFFTLADCDGKRVLKITSQKGSGVLLFDLSALDLKKYPYMRWRWKVSVFPEQADGRISAKDDQAIAIYIGSGNLLTRHSKAYRWETTTPKHAGGFMKYGFGTVRTHWKCIRNQKDGIDTWHEEECNLCEAMKEIFKGKIPKILILSLTANSQYTRSSSEAYLEYIEFYSKPKRKADYEIYRKTETGVGQK